jgi:hypothetical protein
MSAAKMTAATSGKRPGERRRVQREIKRRAARLGANAIHPITDAKRTGLGSSAAFAATAAGALRVPDLPGDNVELMPALPIPRG